MALPIALSPSSLLGRALLSLWPTSFIAPHPHIYSTVRNAQNGYGMLAPYNFGSRYGSYCVMGSKQVALQLLNAASTIAVQSSIHFSCSQTHNTITVFLRPPQFQSPPATAWSLGEAQRYTHPMDSQSRKRSDDGEQTWHEVLTEPSKAATAAMTAAVNGHRHCVLIFSFGQLVSKLETSPHRFWKLGP